MEKGPRPPRRIMEQLLRVISIKEMIVVIPKLAEPTLADATRKDDVRIDIEERALRHRRFDCRILVDQQKFRRAPS